MQGTATRKLIDIKMSVFETLSRKARLKGVSLKRYIEDLLEEDSRKGDIPVPEGVTDDERLQYILSK